MLRVLPRTREDVVELSSVRERSRFADRDQGRSSIAVLPIAMSPSEFRDGLGGALEARATSLFLLPAQSALSVPNLAGSFRSIGGPDVVLLDCHGVRSAPMCRAVARVRLSGWGGPIFVIVGDQSLSKIPVAMTLGAAEFALPRTPVAEIELRISRLVWAARSGEIAITSTSLPNGSRLEIDWRQQTVLCEAIIVHLTLRELQLFATLIEHLGRTLVPAEIARLSWGRVTDPENMTAAYMSSLRKKLAWFGNRFGVRTIRGQGYRFEISTIEAPETGVQNDQ